MKTIELGFIATIANPTIRVNAKMIAERFGEGKVKDLGVYDHPDRPAGSDSIHLYQINAMRVLDHQGNDVWEVNDPAAFAAILKSYGFTPRPNPALEFCNQITHGYINRLESQYKSSIRFTQGGLARASCVCGWLTGLYQAGNLDAANTLATAFISQLEYLAGYGGTVDFEQRRINNETYSIKVPRYTVELSDDGTSHGFSVMWYLALPTVEQVDAAIANGKKIKVFDLYPSVSHVFSFNGGLLYHGPGGGENFAVSLNSRPWSIHT